VFHVFQFLFDLKTQNYSRKYKSIPENILVDNISGKVLQENMYFCFGNNIFFRFPEIIIPENMYFYSGKHLIVSKITSDFIFSGNIYFK